MLGAAPSPLTANAPSVPEAHSLFLWTTSTDGRIARRFYVSFLLASGVDKCVQCAAVWTCLLSCIFRGSHSMQLLLMCMCCMAPRRQALYFYLWPLEEQRAHGRVIMNSMSAVAAVRTMSTSSCKDKKGAQILTVCARMRSSAPPLERMPCSLVCHHASSVLAGYPTLVVTFFDYQPRTLAHLNTVLPGAG